MKKKKKVGQINKIQEHCQYIKFLFIRKHKTSQLHEDTCIWNMNVSLYNSKESEGDKMGLPDFK